MLNIILPTNGFLSPAEVGRKNAEMRFKRVFEQSNLLSSDLQ
ncbi:MAG: hypothetical protein RLZZ86_2932 [Cyanobacteriota bacterium]|jgi:hypothetical protein